MTKLIASKNNIKHFTDGCHRTCSPQQTLAKAQPHMKAMGITRIANITGLDNIGIDVVTVCRPQSKAISVAQGKGLSLAAAKASGLMEAIETYHGEHIDHPLRLASFNELNKQHRVADVTQLPRLSVSRFNNNLRTLWVEGQDIASNNPCYVPYEVVHCDYSLPLPSGSGSFVMSTNGLASGNTKEEAICHSICELIERDATSLWHLSKKTGKHWPLLDLATVNDINCRILLEKFAQANVAVMVWNITSDINIPTFFATIINRNIDEQRPVYPSHGIGTHMSKNIALARALTEAAQSRLTLISGSRDDIKANSYEHSHNAKQHANYLKVIDQAIDQQDYLSIVDWQHDNIDDDLNLLLTQLKQQNLDQVIVVDLSKKEFDIPVVRTIVPGLEGSHFVPGYTQGRRAKQHVQGGS